MPTTVDIILYNSQQEEQLNIVAVNLLSMASLSISSTKNFISTSVSPEFCSTNLKKLGIFLNV
ncbi:hypothetical protein ALC53_02495 [Atta colombica]|uniref:Uncharacterized protein n=1 Tax=Atta colombica TaxID=520822 RepID=A0A195BRX1_9HYME|nr:hypothetical protein ALC53_02495 [Atta colombica]